VWLGFSATQRPPEDLLGRDRSPSGPCLLRSVSAVVRVCRRGAFGEIAPPRRCLGEVGNGVMERFSNLTEAGVNCCRSIPKQEPFQVADPFNEFWAKETSASKNGNRSLTLFPRFLTPFPCPQE